MFPLRLIRKDILRMSQRHLATLLGVTSATIGNWERGRSVPSLTHLVAIRRAVLDRGAIWQDWWIWGGN